MIGKAMIKKIPINEIMVSEATTANEAMIHEATTTNLAKNDKDMYNKHVDNRM